MIIKIENNAFSAEINTKGAELQNLIRKNGGMDVIWHGDKSVWGNHAPLLFPYVARCLGGYFMIEGKNVNIPAITVLHATLSTSL